MSAAVVFLRDLADKYEMLSIKDPFGTDIAPRLRQAATELENLQTGSAARIKRLRAEVKQLKAPVSCAKCNACAGCGQLDGCECEVPA